MRAEAKQRAGGCSGSVRGRWAHAMAAHRCGREVYQTSTMGALLDGVYEGDVTTRELLRHGDFGLGTFNRLDGEMLVLGGVCYQLRGDGSAWILWRPGLIESSRRSLPPAAIRRLNSAQSSASMRGAGLTTRSVV